MSKRFGVVDVLKLLERSNCGECGLPTCMAFAALAVKGERSPSDCPRITAEALEAFDGLGGDRDVSGDDQVDGLELLMRQVADLDFDDVAERLGGGVKVDRLAVPCMGRIFEIDGGGQLYAQCHVNRWVHAPLLDYIVSGAGEEPRGEWAHFHELSGTASWVPFFAHRCEGAIKSVVDEHHETFFEIMSLFEAESPNIGDDLKADWALVIYPFPKVPLLVCYWKAEDDFPSKLSVLFDRSTEANLSPGSVFTVTQGIAQMLHKMVTKHSYKVS